MAKRPGGAMVQNNLPTRSQLIPIITKWEELKKKSQFAPGIFCILAFFAMTIFGSMDTIVVPISAGDGNYIDPRGWIYTSNFLIILAVFLTMASLYFIYRVVGKSKSWWALLGAMGFTAYYLWLFKVHHEFIGMYDFFHLDLAGGEPSDNLPFFTLFMRHFLGTGFFEETVKALPVLALALWAPKMRPDLRAKFGVEEPLDGILIGVAAGGGFAIAETLLQYVPNVLVHTWIVMALAFHGVKAPDMGRVVAALNGNQLLALINEGSAILGTSIGLKSLIIRSIDLSFGHMAYSGYFGYFIGLAFLKPQQQRWKILGIGLISAAIPHALWDSVASLDSTPLSAAVAVFSYAVLAAAILKAREISPNRSLLQPSVVFGGFAAGQAGDAVMNVSKISVALEPVAIPAPAPLPAPAAVEAHGNAAPNGASPLVGNRLRVGARHLVILPGLRLLAHQAPGLEPSSPGGAVAEVTRNPQDPTVLGLTNLSTAVWQVLSASGTRRAIASGQTVRLAPGTKIDFGQIDGEVC